MATKADAKTAPAVPAKKPPPAMPAEGGSYVRQKDGSFVPNLDDEAMANRDKAARDAATASKADEVKP